MSSFGARRRIGAIAIGTYAWWLHSAGEFNIDVSPFTPLNRNRHLTVTRDARHWPAPAARTSPLSDRSNGVRIAFRLRGTGEFGALTDPHCAEAASGHNAGQRLMELPPTLRDARSAREWEVQREQNGSADAAEVRQEEEEGDRGGRILDFGTSVATDLKILWLGDSVAEQFGRAFDSAATGVPEADALEYARRRNVTISDLPPDPRRVISAFRADGAPRTCVFASAPVRGGGAVALWRVVKLFFRARMDLPACNSFAGGWSQDHLRQILEHEYKVPGAGGDEIGAKIGHFDAVVLRIQLGWMKASQITIEGIDEGCAGRSWACQPF